MDAPEVEEKIRVDTVKEKQKNGSVYVYERRSRYNREKKRYDAISKKLIGKIPKGHSLDEKPIPTRDKKKVTSESKISLTIPNTSTAMMRILKTVTQNTGIEEEIKQAIPDNSGMAKKVQTAAMYLFASDGDSWPGLFNWTHKYLQDLPYNYNPISEDMAHEMFEFLGEHPEIKERIFLKRAGELAEEELLALDSTTFAIETQSGEIHFVRYSIHKDHLIKQVFKVVVIYAIKRRRAVAYAIIPGNITDSATVPTVLEKLKFLKLNNLELVSDGGYCTDGNIGLMLAGKQPFLDHIDADASWIYDLIDKKREEIIYGGEIIRADSSFSGIKETVTRTFAYTDPETRKEKTIESTVYVFIYYSPFKFAKDDCTLRTDYNTYQMDLLEGAALLDDKKKVENFSKKFMIIKKDQNGTIISITRNDRAWKKKTKTNGFLVLVGTIDQSLDQAFEKYRSREGIEEDIKNVKMHTGAKTVYKQSEETIDGQYLVQFEASTLTDSFQVQLNNVRKNLCIINGTYPHDSTDNLKKERKLRTWLSKTSKHNILTWFDGVKIMTLDNGSEQFVLKPDYTERDRLLLNKLGIEVPSEEEGKEKES